MLIDDLSGRSLRGYAYACKLMQGTRVYKPLSAHGSGGKDKIDGTAAMPPGRIRVRDDIT